MAIRQPPRVVARCQGCGTSQRWDHVQLLERLRSLGLFKREQDPDPELVRTLLTSRAGEIACPTCHQTGLTIESLSDEDTADWNDARCCEHCTAVLDPERLEVFPEARLCSICQQRDEQRAGEGDPEYCPQCGAVMELRVSRASGLSRYVLVCRACRR